MPSIAEFARHTPDTLTHSVGGSVLIKSGTNEGGHLNRDFVRGFIDYCSNQIKAQRQVIAVVGGGTIARRLIRDAQELGITSAMDQDQLGISVTTQNAYTLYKIMSSKGFVANIREPGEFPRHPGVYIQGGDFPGHTTDFVAVRTALEVGQSYVFNISITKGLHPATNDGRLFDSTEIIPHMNWDRYLDLFPEDHEPGRNIPFDPIAASLARKKGLTVFLVGQDLENLEHCLRGDDFEGTILHPADQTPDSI